MAGVLLATLAACPAANSRPCRSDDQCEGGRCRRGACGPACLEDWECGAGQVCLGGTCGAMPECAADADCATGFTCQAGQCRCTRDSACAVNQACLNGRCGDRPQCSTDADCAQYGRRCEPAQGICVPPCVQPSDCAPGVDPQLAPLLYQCQQGSCRQRCLSDATCGAGLYCQSGGCARATCTTLGDCPAGQYCTSAQSGHCVAWQACASSAECPAGSACATFPPGACPPGFPCAQALCQALPRCLLDGDCAGVSAGPAFCQDQRCQPTTACAGGPPCPTGQLCVAGVCVPGGCRGSADCPPDQACVEGRCATAPSPSSIQAVVLTPRTAVLAVGDSLQLSLLAYASDGSSFPLTSASFSVLAEDGSPSSAATVDATGRVTAVSPGRIRVRGAASGAAALPDEASLTLYDSPASGRRVVVIDAATRQPLAGVRVLGCDSPPDGAPCPSPQEVTTDAKGQADFPFSGATASFSAASPALRPDGLPQYDRVSVASTAAQLLLLPLTANPVHGAAGFTATLSFQDVHSTGSLWLGFAALSSGDPSALDFRTLLGDTFYVTLPGSTQRLPVPGSLVASADVGFGFPFPLKATSYGLGQAGRRAAIGFAGKLDPAQLTLPGAAELLAYTSAMDYALSAFNPIALLPLVPDTADLNGDGRCSDPQRCPAGPQELPDYAHFPPLSFTPGREQQQRTEVVVPNLPPGLDTAVVAVVDGTDETGLVPLGLSSRAGGLPGLDGSRPVGSVVLRSGAPYGGVEVGSPGIWATAAALAGGGATGTSANLSARVALSPSLPTRVVLPPFLPLAEGSSWSAASRTFSPGQPAWNALASAGASLGRLVLTGTDSRHVVYFGISGSQTALRVPDSPSDAAGTDAASQATGAEVTGIELPSGLAPDDVLDLAGANLTHLPTLMEGYSHFEF